MIAAIPDEPGGCYPPHWPAPPRCWPPYPPPTEPDPESLDAVVDWMTYPHPELHRMVHEGLDLPGAMEVSAQWARLGDDLGEIGTALGEIVEQSAAAWEGPAADLARQTLAALTHWAADTGTLATKVSACVTVEVDNATNARDEMPAPPWPIPRPVPMPQPVELFTTNDWGGAAAITTDPSRALSRERALHEQAARTLERFQTSSREVYETVPQFSPPRLGGPLVTHPEPPPPPQTPPQTTIPQGPGGGAPAAPLTAAGPGTPGVTTAAPGRTPAPPPSDGPTPGTAETPAQNRPPAATAGSAPGRSGGSPAMGGVPMGGAAGAGGGEDVVRKPNTYVREEDDIWGEKELPTIPPVIGDRRA